MNIDDNLDQLVNDALAEYCNAEPLTGMEDRVLYRLRLHVKRQRRFFWRCGGVAAAAAAIAIVVWVGLGVRTPQQPPAKLAQKQTHAAEPRYESAQTTAGHQAAQDARSVAEAARRKQSHDAVLAQVVRSEPEPMREQFPTPAPLTSSERALLVLAQTHPAVLQELPQTDIDKQIAIAPITINPLVDGSGGPQGEN